MINCFLSLALAGKPHAAGQVARAARNRGRASERPRRASADLENDQAGPATGTPRSGSARRRSAERRDHAPFAVAESVGHLVAVGDADRAAQGFGQSIHVDMSSGCRQDRQNPPIRPTIKTHLATWAPGMQELGPLLGGKCRQVMDCPLERHSPSSDRMSGIRMGCLFLVSVKCRFEYSGPERRQAQGGLPSFARSRAGEVQCLSGNNGSQPTGGARGFEKTRGRPPVGLSFIQYAPCLLATKSKY